MIAHPFFLGLFGKVSLNGFDFCTIPT